MSDSPNEPQKLRDLAAKARRMANSAVDPLTRLSLTDFADELEQQAEALEPSNDR